jgi:hypothetical protein
MSSLKRKSPTTEVNVIEKLDSEKSTSVEAEYKPQHPLIALMEKKEKTVKPDHLDGYVEVDPYENKH